MQLDTLQTSSLFFYRNCDPRDLHSFPTRRSSDLEPGQVRPRGARRAHHDKLRRAARVTRRRHRSEEHTSELQSHSELVCRLLLEKKKSITTCAQRPRTELPALISKFDRNLGMAFL